jgi:hypothetical protein
MCLSGAFSEGGQALFDRLATIKFPAPITAGSLSYLAARQRWADWWMRIFQRNILDVVAKSIASGIRIFNALAPTALPIDYAAEAADTMDSSDSDSETEPQSSWDEQPSTASTPPMSPRMTTATPTARTMSTPAIPQL